MNNPPPRDVVVFTEAIRLPAIERAAYLARACADDAELRQKVEALLDAHDRVGDFLEEPLTGTGSDAREDALGEKPGDRIGRYRLLQQIGEGGCGVVYMAEQEEPVRRRVALKIIKPGMDTRSVIARFEAERQALALMDHPSIAKVFDAGATESGRPYFVMELIRGTKITEYCDQQALSTKDRLQLFVQVCHAVQHAHQKGIIHRDLKPSNILVTTTPECVALPVVIDFGIAKATTNQQLTDKTLFTAFEMLIGTPAYMSPEQTALTSADVDTRTDIYSLGVLLYELLTGSTPFDASELLKAGLDEVRKVIREQNPPRPSARLSKLTASDLTTVAQRRHAEPPALIRSVRGDLDWIVMRALEKDRARRYETANGLALDVQRYLEDEVIAARPPSRRYRLRKLIARNRVAFFGVLIIFGLLVTSLVLVSTLLARERQARHQAEAESAKSQQVTLFLEETLRGAGLSAAQGRDATMLREILDGAAKRIREDLADQPATRAQLQVVIGQVYQQLAAFSQAEACFRDAIALWREHPADQGQQLAAALSELSVTLGSLRQVNEMMAAVNESLQLRRTLFAAESAEVATALLRLGNAYYVAGKYDDAERETRASLAIRRRLFGSQSLEVADALNALAADLRMRDQFAEAVKPAREALGIRQTLLGPNHPAVAQSLRALATSLGNDGQWEEADTYYAAAAETWRKIAGEQHPEYARTQMARAFMLKDAGLLPQSEAVFRELVPAQRKVVAPGPSFLMEILLGLGEALHRRGDFAEAESCMRESLQLAEQTLPEGHSYIATIADALAANLLIQGKGDEAEKLLNDRLPPALVAQPQSAFLLAARAALYGRWGRWEEGVSDATTAAGYRATDLRAFELLALLLVQAGHEDAYHALCRETGAFRDVTDASTARRIARACLLLPSVGTDFTFVSPFVEIADRSRDLVQDPISQCSQALLAYRHGNYAEVVQRTEPVLADRPSDIVQAQAYPLLALAHFRLGHEVEAKNAMEQLRVYQKSRSLFPPGESSAVTWRERTVGDILAREADLTVIYDRLDRAENPPSR